MGWGISAERASLAMSQIASPDRESFHIGVARLAYIEGAIDVEEFEGNVAHVLAGGTLNAQGRIEGAPLHPDLPMFHAPAMEAIRWAV